MLHTETVDTKTLVLIQELMNKVYLQNFYLVRGTALALQIGHRTSTDIDLFSHIKFDKDEAIENIKSDYGELEMSSNLLGIFTYINEIKTDIVHHPYKHLEPLIEIDGIRMVSKRDIASMKLSAITRRAKKRDFVDIYKLLDEITLPQMIDDFIEKYGDNGNAYIIRSLMYFDKADEDFVPKCFFDFNWEKIKHRIVEEVRNL